MKSKILKLALSMLTLPFAAACGMPTFYKNDARKAPELQFGKDGKFKILHLTDIHEVDPEMDDDENPIIPIDKSRETMHVIEQSLEKTNPDLVIFGGDNLSGYWQEFDYEYVQKTIDKITAPIRKRGIPFAIVYGNHDSEISKFFREFQMLCYLRYENFIGTLNAAEMHGCGNQNIIIRSSDGKKAAFNLWLVDSNDYPHDETGKQLHGYDHVHRDQLDWYERTAEQLKAENGGKPLPAMLFQHIPVQQEFDALLEVPAGTPGALSEREGSSYILNPEMCVSGVMGEMPSPPANKDRTQFDLWKKHGDVIAAVFGHDHVNDFIVDVEGIKLVQTFGAGYHTYGEMGGGRLIVLDENDLTTFETESFRIPRITETDFR